MLIYTRLCRLTKHDGLHACWERLQSGIPIDRMSACDGKQCTNVQSDHNYMFGSTNNEMVVSSLGKASRETYKSVAALIDVRGIKGTTSNFR